MDFPAAARGTSSLMDRFRRFTRPELEIMVMLVVLLALVLMVAVVVNVDESRDDAPPTWADDSCVNSF